MLAALFALFLVASSPPDTTQQIEQQQQPGQQYSSPKPSVKEQETKSDKGTGEEKNNQHGVAHILEFLREYNPEVVTFSTAVMAIFTVVLSIATVSMGLSGRKHARQELRAYVLLRDVQLVNSDSVIEATAYVKNWGKTPAYNFRIVCSLALGTPDTTEFKPNPTPSEYRSVSTLSPGHEEECFRKFPRPLTEEEFVRIAQEKLRIFVFGRLDYTDAFEKARFANFRYYSIPIIRKGNELQLFLGLSSTGNESN
jgi:hypothetical protein